MCAATRLCLCVCVRVCVCAHTGEGACLCVSSLSRCIKGFTICSQVLSNFPMFAKKSKTRPLHFQAYNTSSESQCGRHRGKEPCAS